MARNESVLIVEDTGSMQMIYADWLKKAGFRIETASTGNEALALLRAERFDATLLDLQLPDISGFDILDVIRDEAIPTTVVVITSSGSITTAIDAMRAGAYDFVVKPPAEDRLITTVGNAAEREELRQVVASVRESTADIRKQGFIGSSPAMLGVYKTVQAVASSMVPIFITGESGTGKEVCANAIHQSGNRVKKPFVAVNCAAIPKDLLESEIFGHMRGSFTGATADRRGAAKSADGGTLFLDEICELDLSLQAKLLRFLQTSSVQAVGSDKTERVDVRIVCATNRDPYEEVAEGRFREDLFYRLHVIPLTLPPLRERGRDVLELAEQFLVRYGADEGKEFTAFSAEAEAAMLAHLWPGNVRELQNVIRNVAVLNDGQVVEATMLPLGKSPSPPVRPVAEPYRPEHQVDELSPHRDTGKLVVDLSLPFIENERRLIEAVIEECNGSIPKAARLLKLSPSTIYRKRELWDEVATSESPSDQRERAPEFEDPV